LIIFKELWLSFFVPWRELGAQAHALNFGRLTFRAATPAGDRKALFCPPGRFQNPVGVQSR
jgi:hypothetical protein